MTSEANVSDDATPGAEEQTSASMPCVAGAAPVLKKPLGAVSLVVIGFFWVSGGVYGNESLLSAGPPLVVLVATLVLPLIFSLPNALLTAEVTSGPEFAQQPAISAAQPRLLTHTTPLPLVCDPHHARPPCTTSLCTHAAMRSPMPPCAHPCRHTLTHS